LRLRKRGLCDRAPLLNYPTIACVDDRRRFDRYCTPPVAFKLKLKEFKGKRGCNKTYARAFVEADVDGSTEEDVVGLRELEGLETSRQRVSIDRVEILKQIRIH